MRTTPTDGRESGGSTAGSGGVGSSRARYWRRGVLLALLVILAVPTARGWLAAQEGSTLALPAANSALAGSPLADARLQLREVLTGLREPLFLTHAGDGSGDLYVVEKAGRIRVARSGVVRAQPFLDIVPLVNSASSERGLLGLAFHPRYVTNGFFYVNYTDRQGDTVVARYIATADRAVGDPGTAMTILAFDQPFPNHNGGNLVFGPDGMLWIGTGDGGSGGDPFEHGQSRDTLLGKMLRIDVDRGDPYAIPPDNPFIGDPSARPEIWATGLRNPWRYSFDRATGDLYIGDVGQNAWEEVDFTPSGSPGGLNYGWNTMEATHCYPAGSSCDPAGLVLPIAEYRTGREGCSVTSGYVYRGTTHPALVGTYLFTAFCSGTLWGMTRDASGAWQQIQLLPGPGGHAGYSSFGEDEAGELYITSLDSGVVFRITAN